METRLRKSASELLAKFETPPSDWWFYFEEFFEAEFCGADYGVAGAKFLSLTEPQQTLRVVWYVAGSTMTGGLQGAFYQEPDIVPHLMRYLRLFGWKKLENRVEKCFNQVVGSEAKAQSWLTSKTLKESRHGELREKERNGLLTRSEETELEGLNREEEERNSWGGAGLLKDERSFEAFNEWFYAAQCTSEARGALRCYVEKNIAGLVVGAGPA